MPLETAEKIEFLCGLRFKVWLKHGGLFDHAAFGEARKTK